MYLHDFTIFGQIVQILAPILYIKAKKIGGDLVFFHRYY